MWDHFKGQEGGCRCRSLGDPPPVHKRPAAGQNHTRGEPSRGRRAPAWRTDPDGSTFPSSVGVAERVGLVQGKNPRVISALFALADVEPPSLARASEVLSKDLLVAKARELWREETSTEMKGGARDLPLVVDCDNVRDMLLQSQQECSVLRKILEQKHQELDPGRSAKRRTNVSKPKNVLNPLESAQYRLAPNDGVLEHEMNVSTEVFFVPCIPEVQMPTESKPMTWRFWLFSYCHCTFMEPHRKAGPTFQLLKRTGWWPRLNDDFNTWYYMCGVCHMHRAKPVPAPLRSILADEGRVELLPWQDVMIDVQGPFTKADTGDQYILSYHCTCLKVPKLAAFKSLQTGYFSRALVSCVMKTRIIPNVVRSDRGPEMTSYVQEEFLALCAAQQVFGAALTPRHQGLNERGHQEVLTSHLILMHSICKAYPQEWASLVEPLEYLYDTEPQGPLGLSAHDMSTGYALVSDVDRRLAPFMVPQGAAGTAVAARVFERFRGLYGAFSRWVRQRAQQVQDQVNRRRNLRVFDAGETVFRKKPSVARPPKQLLAEPAAGPYQVVEQRTLSSVVLRDPATGALVDEGANIPLDQILAGPRRALVRLDRDSDVRGIGSMVRQEGLDAGYAKVPGKRTGWGGLAPGAMVAYQTTPQGPSSRQVTVGKVLTNDRPGQYVLVQPHAAYWKNVKVVHLPLYQTSEGHSLKVSGKQAVETVLYQALVKTVRLLVEGEIGHADARELALRGWGLKLEEQDLEDVLGRLAQLSARVPLLSPDQERVWVEDEGLKAFAQERPYEDQQPIDHLPVLNYVTKELRVGEEIIAAFKDKGEFFQAQKGAGNPVGGADPSSGGSAVGAAGAPEAHPEVEAAGWIIPPTSEDCRSKWTNRLKAGDTTGVPLLVAAYIPLRGEEVRENVRKTNAVKRLG